MELLVLNENFETQDILDVFESAIWTDRFYKYGDFEIYTTASKDMVNKLWIDYYIQMDESEHMMIIEVVQITSDIEEGKKLIVKGRSLESILDRRIVWDQITLDGYLEGQIEKLLNQNVISPSIEERRIPNFVFKYSGDPKIEQMTIQAQYTGDVIYDVISTICIEKKIGFKVTFNEDNQTFEFQLYSGVDRSYDQETNPHVVFSSEMNNIVNSDYIEGKNTLKTTALVAGEGEGSARKKVVTGDSTASGLARRELYVDARDISSSLEDGTTLSTSAYNDKLIQRGNERLAENKTTKAFNGQVETQEMYRYGEHFFMGDIVQLEDEFGKEAKTRVIEYMYSDSQSGGKEDYPTFEIEENEE